MKKILTLIIVSVLIITGCGAESKNDTTRISESLDWYMEYKNFNSDSIKNLAPDDFWDLLKKEFNIDIENEENFKTYYKDYIDRQKTVAKEFYGRYNNKDYPSYIYQSKSEELVSDEIFTNIKNALNQYYGIDKNKIKKAYNVSFTYDIVGDKKIDKKHELITFVRISGKYYPISDYYTFLVNPQK